MTLANFASPTGIYVEPRFLTAVARPNVILLLPPDVQQQSIEGIDAFSDVFGVTVGEDGVLRIGHPRDAVVDWSSLGIRPVAQVFVAGVDERILGRLSLLKPQAVKAAALTLAQARGDGYREALTHISKKNDELFNEVYALRLQVEEAKVAQFEVQESFRRRGSFMPWMETSHAISGKHLVLGPSAVEVEQVLALKPAGFVAFDLHVDWPRSEADIDLTARLFILDNGFQVGEWKSNLRSVGGWVHFRLKEALGDIGIGLVLKLSATPARNAPNTARLSLADVSNIFGADILVDGEAREGSALTYRVWKAPIGLQVPTIYNHSAFATRKDPTPQSFVMPMTARFKDSRLIEPLRSQSAGNPGMVSSDSNYFQIHPVPDANAIVRIPNALEFSIQEIAAEVGLGHPQSPFVQFAMAIIPSTMSDETLRDFDPEGFVAFSGWVTAGANAPSLVTAKVPDQRRGIYDLALATRMTTKSSTDYAWARFYDLRGYWNPEHSFPVSFSPPADFEPLKRLRDEQCDRRLRFKETRMPLVTLVCCLHRPEDIPNLLRQLLRQSYVSQQVLIALNGAKVSEQDVLKITSVLPDAEVWIDDGENLPTVLNNCVTRAKGEFFLKIDADDIYGEEYVADLVREAIVTQAAIVGKPAFGVIFPDDDIIAMHRSHPHHQYVPQVAGGTMCIQTELLREIPFDTTFTAGSDYKLQIDFVGQGHRVWAADPFNYLHVRYRNEDHHTWKGTVRDYRAWPNFRSYGPGEKWLFFV